MDCSDLFEGMAPLDPMGDDDRDGIPNDADGAPLLAEDKDGFQDEDGIPDPDTPEAKLFAAAMSAGRAQKYSDVDKDNIADAYDLCYDQPEDRDGFEDDDGCPEGDNDLDGTPDDTDPCPNVPGTWCSQEKGAHAAPTPKEQATAQQSGDYKTLMMEDIVVFTPKTAKLDMKKSRAALNNVLSELMAEPTLRIEIRGHSEQLTSPDAEQKLAQQRADAVRAQLIKLGISGNRLTSMPGGVDSRQVEFVILP